MIIPKDLFKTQANFNGNEMAEKIISEIKNFKLEDSLPLPEYFIQNIPQDIMNQKCYADYGSEELSIKQINQLTNNLTSLFIQNGVDSECSLADTCAAILIECSRTLSPENKLSCVMLATSLVRAFNVLEMPYSVVVFADYKFQFEIKKFDENHSDDIINQVEDIHHYTYHRIF